MYDPRAPNGSSSPGAGSSRRRRLWLVGCLAAFCMAMMGTTCGLMFAWLRNARQAMPAPAGSNQVLGSPFPGGTAFEAGAHTLPMNWPGSPLHMPAVTLPPAVTDPARVDRAESLYRRGAAAFDDGRWEEAIGYFDQALEEDPRHAAAYCYRGAARSHLGPHTILETRLRNREQAALDFTHAIAADPAWDEPYWRRGNVFENRAHLEPLRDNRRQWYELALADYDRAVELAGPWGPANCGRAVVYEGLNLVENVLSEALQCTCDRNNCMQIITRAYLCTGNYTEAVRLFAQWELQFPEDLSANWDRGVYYTSQGEYEKALREFDIAAGKWTGDFTPGQLLYDRAAAEYYLGNEKQAEQTILSARRYTWTDWGAPYYYLGMIWLRQGRTREAIEVLQWAEATLDEDDPLLAATRAELGRLTP